MARPDPDSRKNRDEDLKPGSPPRPAAEPAGSEGSTRTPKTATDPASGAPRTDAPAPATADD